MSSFNANRNLPRVRFNGGNSSIEDGDAPGALPQVGQSEKCYMKELGSCGGGISGEHLISESIMVLLKKDGDFSISGLLWLADGDEDPANGRFDHELPLSHSQCRLVPVGLRWAIPLSSTDVLS